MRYIPVYVLSAALALFIYLFAAQGDKASAWTAKANAELQKANVELVYLLAEREQLQQQNSSLKEQIARLESRQVAEVPAKFTVVTGKDLRQFMSKDELQEWLRENYIRDAPPNQCVDTALELCQLAWHDGYQMSTEIQGDGKPKGHMICSTMIGNIIYFLDPADTAVWVGGKSVQ